MTYPNVLVMSYLKETGQLTPEWQMKLEAAINAGYQRLLTFEVSGGGFDWYGHAPAKTILTAYGILELTDMNAVYPIDTRVIDRARDVLYERQNGDGSWSLDVLMHTWNQLADAKVPITAYVLWSLKAAGYDDANMTRAEAWLRKNGASEEDPYVRALVALALGDAESLKRVEAAAVLEGDQASWKTSGEGLCHARGDMASLEATALSILALLTDGASPLIDKGLTTLARGKDASGSWHSTQATILSIKALLEASRTPAKPAEPQPIRLTVNGREIEGAFKPLAPETHDLVQQIEIPVMEGDNRIELAIQGKARAGFQVFGRYYLPWSVAPRSPQPLLEMSTRYDKTELSLDDTLRATTTLTYRGPGTFMVIADLGIPPGFTPDQSSFEALVVRKTIDKFTLTGRQITLYFGQVEKGRTYEIEYALRPRFPIRAKTPRSNLYEYYTPENRASTEPALLRVTDK